MNKITLIEKVKKNLDNAELAIRTAMLCIKDKYQIRETDFKNANELCMACMDHATKKSRVTPFLVKELHPVLKICVNFITSILDLEVISGENGIKLLSVQKNLVDIIKKLKDNQREYKGYDDFENRPVINVEKKIEQEATTPVMLPVKPLPTYEERMENIRKNRLAKEWLQEQSDLLYYSNNDITSNPESKI